MGFTEKSYGGGLGSTPTFALTTSAANETTRWAPAANLVPALLQAKSISAIYGPSETWVPVAFAYIIAVATTVTAPVVQLRKNGVAPATGTPQATVPISAATTTETMVPFGNYSFSAADAIGDVWSAFVTTTSTAGQISIRIIYACRSVAGVNVGVPY
jgi:hypothetical protein